MSTTTYPPPAPVSDYGDLVARVKIALDEHSDPAVLAGVLFGLGINDVRLADYDTKITLGSLAIDRGWGYWRLSNDGIHQGTNTESIALAVVKAHRQSVEVAR